MHLFFVETFFYFAYSAMLHNFAQCFNTTVHLRLQLCYLGQERNQDFAKGGA